MRYVKYGYDKYYNYVGERYYPKTEYEILCSTREGMNYHVFEIDRAVEETNIYKDYKDKGLLESIKENLCILFYTCNILIKLPYTKPGYSFKCDIQFYEDKRPIIIKCERV